MLGAYPVGRPPLGARLDNTTNPEKYAGFVNFDVLDTLISQYFNSPVLKALVEYSGAWLDGATYDDFFFKNIWQLSTAKGYGLDILGRIVGASRVISVPAEDTYVGFAGQSTAQNWGHGIWYRGADATNNVRLGDDVYRRVILAKARANVCGCTVPEINAILVLLFPGYGNSYVKDNADGTLTYHFGVQLTAVDYAIASQEGLLPRPTGKRILIEQG